MSTRGGSWPGVADEQEPIRAGQEWSELGQGNLERLIADQETARHCPGGSEECQLGHRAHDHRHPAAGTDVDPTGSQGNCLRLQVSREGTVLAEPEPEALGGIRLRQPAHQSEGLFGTGTGDGHLQAQLTGGDRHQLDELGLPPAGWGGDEDELGAGIVALTQDQIQNTEPGPGPGSWLAQTAGKGKKISWHR